MKFVAALVLTSLIAVLVVDCHNPHDEKGGRNPLDEAHQTETQLHKNTVDGDAQYPDTIGEAQIWKKTVFVDDSEEDKPWKEAHLTKGKVDWKSGLRGSKCKATIGCSLLGGSCVAKANLCKGRLSPVGCKGNKCECCIPPGEMERSLQNLTMELQSVKDMNMDLSNNMANIKGMIESSQHNLTMKLQSVEEMNVALANNLTAADAEQEAKMNYIKGVIESNQHNLTMKLQSVEDMNVDLANNMANIKGVIESSLLNLTMKLQSVEHMNVDLANKLKELIDARHCPDGSTEPATTQVTDGSTEPASTQVTDGSTEPASTQVTDGSTEPASTQVTDGSTEPASTQVTDGSTEPASTQVTDGFTRPVAVQCPSGFYKLGSHCYKVYTDTPRTWLDSKSKCETEGLVMAGKPDDAITLRSYIVNNIGDKYVWLSAKGDGTVFRWESSGETISNTSALWYPGMPTSARLSTNHCLMLLSSQSYVNNNPTQPFWPWGHCTSSGSGHALCECARHCPDGSTEPASTQVTDGSTEPASTQVTDGSTEPASTQVTDGFTRPVTGQCPEGFFKLGLQCYKMYNDTRRSWNDSKSKCETEGLVMATKPDDAITLRSYIVNNIGDKFVWLSAKGDGTVFRWAISGEAISNTNSLWYPGSPRGYVTTSYCLMLLSDATDMRTSPTQPFYTYSCSGGVYTLCEYPEQCPEGFFKLGSHCYKMYNGISRTWLDSKSKCESDGLMMATKPDDAITLRSYIINNIGDRYVWLGAKPDGKVFRWASSGEAINNTNPLWRPGYPGSVATSRCLTLLSWQSSLSNFPTQPFSSSSCSDSYNLYTLCEYAVQCPEGFFTIGSHCYKMYTDTRRTWLDSKSKCESEGLVMATKPDAAIALRSYTVKYYSDRYIWLSAKGDGTVFRWESSGEATNNTNALWYPGHPISTWYCLVLMSDESDLNRYPTQPFYSESCSRRGYTLCEYAVQCPEGFFTIGSHCYKIFTDTARTWLDSKSKCEAEGLVMAGKPDDAITLRNYTIEHFGDKYVWLSARGDGTEVRWERVGEAIGNTNPLLLPGSFIFIDTCLMLLSTQGYMNSHPTQPFCGWSCSDSRSGHALCEYNPLKRQRL